MERELLAAFQTMLQVLTVALVKPFQGSYDGRGFSGQFFQELEQYFIDNQIPESKKLGIVKGALKGNPQLYYEGIELTGGFRDFQEFKDRFTKAWPLNEVEQERAIQEEIRREQIPTPRVPVNKREVSRRREVRGPSPQSRSHARWQSPSCKPWLAHTERKKPSVDEARKQLEIEQWFAERQRSADIRRQEQEKSVEAEEESHESVEEPAEAEETPAETDNAPNAEACEKPEETEPEKQEETSEADAEENSDSTEAGVKRKVEDSDDVPVESSPKKAKVEEENEAKEADKPINEATNSEEKVAVESETPPKETGIEVSMENKDMATASYRLEEKRKIKVTNGQKKVHSCVLDSKVFQPPPCRKKETEAGKPPVVENGRSKTKRRQSTKPASKPPQKCPPPRPTSRLTKRPSTKLPSSRRDDRHHTRPPHQEAGRRQRPPESPPPRKSMLVRAGVG